MILYPMGTGTRVLPVTGERHDMFLDGWLVGSTWLVGEKFVELRGRGLP